MDNFEKNQDNGSDINVNTGVHNTSDEPDQSTGFVLVDTGEENGEQNKRENPEDLKDELVGEFTGEPSGDLPEEQTEPYAEGEGLLHPEYDYSDTGHASGCGTVKEPKFITRKAFVIVLILAMICTSGLTLLIANLTGGLGGTKEISATNYTLAKSTGSELSIQEVIAKNENAVVEITTESTAYDNWLSNYVTTGAGSGVIVDTDGYILTCNHVVEGANKVTVRLKNGTSYEASIVGTDPQNDVAVIKIKGENLSAATYGDSSKMSVGDMVVAIGNPLGQLGGSASSGIISSLDRELTIEGQTMQLLQTDTSINPGNSGGGLFDNHGNLIGIVVAKSTGSDVEGLGFAIPIEHAASIAKDLIEHGHVTNRPALGIELLDASDASVAMEYNLRITGLYVQNVISDEAKAAGLKAGDMFYYFGEKRVESFADFQSALQKYKPGDKVKSIVIRDGKTVELELTIIESQG